MYDPPSTVSGAIVRRRLPEPSLHHFRSYPHRGRELQNDTPVQLETLMGGAVLKESPFSVLTAFEITEKHPKNYSVV